MAVGPFFSNGPSFLTLKLRTYRYVHTYLDWVTLFIPLSEEKSARCPLPNETAHRTSGLYRRGLEVFGLAHKTGGRLRLGVRTYVERYEHVE